MWLASGPRGAAASASERLGGGGMRRRGSRGAPGGVPGRPSRTHYCAPGVRTPLPGRCPADSAGLGGGGDRAASLLLSSLAGVVVASDLGLRGDLLSGLQLGLKGLRNLHDFAFYVIACLVC